MSGPAAHMREAIGRLLGAAGALVGRHAPAVNPQAHDADEKHGRLLTPRRVLIAAVAGLATLTFVQTCGRSKDVPSALARTGKAAEVVYATGVVEPVFWAKVTALQRKRIIEICRCEGRMVKKGEVLARLDDIEERAVLTELEARLNRLKEDVGRSAALVKRSIVSQVTLEEKQTQLREQEARITAQKDRILDLSLRAPIDGVVLRRDGEVGEIASTGPGDTLFWIGQERPLRVVAEVNEDDILKVSKGQRTLLRHEGHTGEPLTGTVDSITPKGDPQTKTFRVYIALPDETPLKIGMSVEANVISREVESAVLVPAEAVGEAHVQQIIEGRVAMSPVEVGIRGTGSVEIRKGLNAGDVVVSPYDKTLTEGMRVTPRGPRSP